MKSDDSSHAEAPCECRQNISILPLLFTILPETPDLAQRVGLMSLKKQLSFPSKAGTLTLVSIQLGWLQEQPLTMVYFYRKVFSYMVGVHSVSSMLLLVDKLIFQA